MRVVGDVFTKTPQVDHDHKTKVVRGLLCILCNHGIGHFKEDVHQLKKAVRYLLTSPSNKVQKLISQQVMKCGSCK